MNAAQDGFYGVAGSMDAPCHLGSCCFKHLNPFLSSVLSPLSSLLSLLCSVFSVLSSLFCRFPLIENGTALGRALFTEQKINSHLRKLQCCFHMSLVDSGLLSASDTTPCIERLQAS